MNYINTYFSRVNHLGETTAERIRRGGEISFEKWKAESPHTVRHLSVERGVYFDAIILTNKDKEYQKIMFLNVSNDEDVRIGDIMTWETRRNEIEKWIIFQEEKKVNDTYRTFWMVRCNYLLRWIDKLGHLQSSWAYVVSSTDDKIKGNFRTWHNLITPQPNKYAEILMPRREVERATNFIIEDESWQVIEYDHTSVPGIIYLSLTENKVNFIYDDLINDIADTDKLANYQLDVPVNPQSFKVGEEIAPQFTLMKNGLPVELETILIPTDNHYAKFNKEHKLIGLKSGTTTIKVQLKDYPQIEKDLVINLIEQPIEDFSAYIEGPDKLRLNEVAIYKLVGTTALSSSVVYTLDNKTIAQFEEITKDDIGEEEYADEEVMPIRCKVAANSKNVLGSVTLTAEYEGQSYTKIIKIIPLW